MYDVGFGDCFLIRFPSVDRDRLVLIDCGVHSASKGSHRLEDVIADVLRVAAEADNRIDVVVATHRHRDHVHGFRDEDRWAKVRVDEVWMPWTEDPDDADARRIRDRQSKRSRLLMGLLPANADASWAAVGAIAENNGFTNARAMSTLHAGFAGNATRYFLPQRSGMERSLSFKTPTLPGVTAHVLGPTRDERAIRDMDPPAGDSYLRIGSGTDLSVDGRGLPFERWRREQKDFRVQYPHFDITDSDLGSVVRAGQADALALAVALEQAVNGTSLMLAFECGDATVLFPGDAQWGTWASAISDERKAEIIARADLYKVGHHGSHNATPRSFVERLFTGRWAFVPVAPTSIPTWADIPREPLLAALALRKGSRVIRSDKIAEVVTAPDVVADGSAIACESGGLWIELSLPTRRPEPTAVSTTPSDAGAAEKSGRSGS